MNFYVIQDWMVKDLKLKGSELLVYACVFGFSQADDTYYTGSAQYLAEMVGTTKRSVFNTLQTLIDKGLIEKRKTLKNGIKFCDYRAVANFTGSEKISPGGSEKISPHNIEEHNIDKRSNINITKKSQELLDGYNEEVKKLLYDWLDVRKQKRVPLTDKALELNLKRLKQYANGKEVQYLEEVIVKGWTAFYPIASFAKEKDYVSKFTIQ